MKRKNKPITIKLISLAILYAMAGVLLASLLVVGIIIAISEFRRIMQEVFVTSDISIETLIIMITAVGIGLGFGLLTWYRYQYRESFDLDESRSDAKKTDFWLEQLIKSNFGTEELPDYLVRRDEDGDE